MDTSGVFWEGRPIEALTKEELIEALVEIFPLYMDALT